MALEIVQLPVLGDNYAWLLHDAASGETVAIDPGDAAPLIAAADARGWTIGAVWNTHWHRDHTDGNAALKDRGATVVAPGAERERIPTLDRAVGEGDTLTIGDAVAEVWEVPGHTAGHVAFVFRDEGVVFTGDTLFALGCGRLFEGTPEQMWANLRRYDALPDDTRVYCGHEYTQSNGRYALSVDPDNAALVERMAAVDRARVNGEPTVPTTIAAERATNPFVRADSAERFAELRRGKDAFKG